MNKRGAVFSKALLAVNGPRLLTASGWAAFATRRDWLIAVRKEKAAGSGGGVRQKGLGVAGEGNSHRLMFAVLPDTGAAFGMQDAEHAKAISIDPVEDGKGESVYKGPMQLPPHERTGLGIASDAMKGCPNAETEISFESGLYLFVPSDGSGKVAAGRTFDDDAACQSVASQASTSSHADPGDNSPRSKASMRRLSSSI